MRRAGKIGLATSAVVAAGVVTGGMLAVGQQLDVADDPGRQLTLQGVETGTAAQDASGVVSGARIRAEGATPKVEEPVVVEQPVVNEVPPSDPVVIAPRRRRPGSRGTRPGSTRTQARREVGRRARMGQVGRSPEALRPRSPNLRSPGRLRLPSTAAGAVVTVATVRGATRPPR